MFFAPTLRTARFAPRAYDRSFERFVNEAFAGARRSPLVEQDDKSWTLSLDVPGFAREDLAISIEGAVLRIESKAEAKRQFKAAYELPQDIDVAASEAKLENGVLTLKLGKLVPVSQATQLQIN
ncbi:Hsp20/alpha crystallin family protein [Variovorax sp. NFACC27]|uniref:Hsp20 family protein n=1 Tax=Variovorax gossypii TaxID=1679495 RepID=A0A3S0H1B3_9BURK|nr:MULTISPECIES: Hsp20/alpha crystallin family protein [Variovorax]SEF24050.1 Molecular chaperone IbpA, HSP20 family [Variovorax sp. NFACC28]SEG23237.1 Molecular chaperone IbpA, HSP20 family [Variovorax sp. NFACC29]SFC48587.1 Molecular chaperone IbpA, HSP20 family [Variovorax sp. NFACC26]SFF93114.1 Molecular chaperone IbpA, HSP20 family [Variovorax sp. NFACC27]MBB3639198.1 HSP20 family molecular chaperone IbpA [Variovorax sp. BK613]